jgi:hypothetical protein
MIANTLPKSLQDNPRLDQWLEFLPGGTVRLKVGKVEIGQGILTALAQIAAEELDVSLGRIAVTSGDTDAAPDEGTTTSSLSVEMSGGSVRIVCAEVAGLARDAAAARLGRPAQGLAIADGAILDDGRPTGLDYWTLGLALDRDVTGGRAAKAVGAHLVVGTSARRLDLPMKLDGAGFLHDMVLPGMRHARVLHRPRMGAALLGVDEAAIVRAGAAFVRRGDFAAVLADSEAAAARAMELARPRWEGGEGLAASMQEAGWLVGRPATRARFGPPDDGRARESATYTRP